ncbi:MAG: DUF2259 domain-containing protein [Spirochaetia bacterium]
MSRLFALDVPNFANLGFSQNSKYFAFAQYGYSVSASEAYGTLVIVDIPTNQFAQGSMLKDRAKHPLTPGDSADGIFYFLLERYGTIRKRFGIEYTNRGRLLYLASSLTEDARKSGLSDNVAGFQSITFRDFQANTQYSVEMNQKVNNMGTAAVSSTVSLDLVVRFSSGKMERYKVGHPSFVRRGVTGYEIERIILTPNGKGLIFVIARKHHPSTNIGIDYMVEAVLF